MDTPIASAIPDQQEDRLTAERVVDEWAADSVIDMSELGVEQIKIEQVHDKYAKLLARAKRQLRADETLLKRMRLAKTDFYVMGPTQAQHDRGWRLPPRGRINSRSEAREYADADPDTIRLAVRAGESQDAVDAITEKVKMIAFRGNRISSAIDWQMFIHGK